jgi:hypothetical protein
VGGPPEPFRAPDRSGPVARGGARLMLQAAKRAGATVTADPCWPHSVAGSVAHRHATQCGGPRSVEDQDCGRRSQGNLQRQSPHSQACIAVQQLVDALLLAFGMGIRLGYQVCLHLMIRLPCNRQSCRSARLCDRPIRSRLVSRFRRRASPSSAPVGASRPSNAGSIEVVLVTRVRGATCWPAAFSCRTHQSIRLHRAGTGVTHG